MHIGLRVGDADACGVEFFLHAFGDFPVDLPVVCSGDPWAADEIDGGIGELVEVDGGFWVVEDELILGDDALEDLLSFFVIGVVADAEDHVDAACGHAGDIGDDFSPDFLVRDDDFLIIEGADDGADEADAIDRAGDASDLDGVPDIEGAVNDEHETCGEIPKGVLEGEGEYERTASDEGECCADIHTSSAERDDEADEEDGAAAHFVDEDFE